MTHHVLYVVSRMQTPSVAATRFCGIGTTSLRLESSDESLRSTIQRVPGAYSSLSVRLTANGASSDTTIRFRKNAGNGNELLAIGAGATGEFTDTSNSDVVAAGDDVSTQWSTGATAAITASIMSIIFTPQDFSELAVMQVAAWDYTLTSNNVSRFSAPMGDIAASATESTKRVPYRVGAQIKNLTVHVSVNSRTTNTTVRTRVNGANGNMSFTIGAGATGDFEDNTNIDNIDNGDDLCQEYAMGASAENLVSSYVSTTYVTREHAYPIFAGFDAGTSQNFNTTTYYPVGGGLNSSSSATESQVQTTAHADFEAFGLFAIVSANTIATSATTLTFRKDSAATALTLSIGAGATGTFENTTNYIPVSDDDAVNYQVVTPNTSGSLTFGVMGIFAFVELSDIAGTQPSMTRPASVTMSQQSTSHIPNMAGFQFPLGGLAA